MDLIFQTLDVFTTAPYTGNPLALVLLPPPHSSILSTAQKQKIAKEFNLSETAFLHLNDVSFKTAAIPEIRLDIFITSAEIPFAGHPTIGAAWFILNKLLSSTHHDKAVIVTKSGRIPISKNGDNVEACIAHNLHIHTRRITNREIFSTDAEIAGRETRAPLVSIVKGMTFLIVELSGPDELARVTPNGHTLHAKAILDDGWNEGFIGKEYFYVDGDAGGRVNVRCRMIESNMEDPATGSAACALAGWLVMSGRYKGDEGGVVRFSLVQGVEMGRRSVIFVDVEVSGEGQIVGVKLAGEAVPVMRGSLEVPQE